MKSLKIIAVLFLLAGSYAATSCKQEDNASTNLLSNTLWSYQEKVTGTDDDGNILEGLNTFVIHFRTESNGIFIHHPFWTSAGNQPYECSPFTYTFVGNQGACSIFQGRTIPFTYNPESNTLSVKILEDYPPETFTQVE